MWAYQKQTHPELSLKKSEPKSLSALIELPDDVRLQDVDGLVIDFGYFKMKGLNHS